MSDFRLALASVPAVSAAEPASLGARERGVVEEAGVFFVVPPVFFGWEDLAEGKAAARKREKGKLDLLFSPGGPVSSHKT